MGEARVALSLDGPVAHIVLARPDTRNAFDGPMLRELREAVGAASRARTFASSCSPAAARSSAPAPTSSG